MSDESRVGRVFAALADPTRRMLVLSLGDGRSVTATELARTLPITRQAVSKHLGALAEAGLVEATRVGRETRYVLTPAPLAEAAAWAAKAAAAWDERLARLAAYAGERSR